MAFRKEKNFAEKHEQQEISDPIIKDKILKRAKNDKIPCAVAFEIAKKLKISPSMTGMAIDLLNIKITKCQLGLFGYKSHKKMLKSTNPLHPDLTEAISEAAVEGRISCKRAWDISYRFGIHKVAVSRACESMRIKIKTCQLGAF